MKPIELHDLLFVRPEDVRPDDGVLEGKAAAALERMYKEQLDAIAARTPWPSGAFAVTENITKEEFDRWRSRVMEACSTPERTVAIKRPIRL